MNPVRMKMRSFCLDVLEHLQSEKMDLWPNLSAQEYRSVEHSFEQRISALCQLNLPKGQLALHRSYVSVYGGFAKKILWMDWSFPEGFYDPAAEVEALFSERPQGIMDFDQLFCSPSSSEKRVERALSYLNPKVGKVLCLGDDDLCSLLLADRFDGEVHVLDLDERLLSFIQEKRPSVHCHRVDLKKHGLPESMRNTYDVILFDPPWEHENVWFFIEKALFCLKQAPSSRVLLSFCPIYLEYDDRKYDLFFRRIASLGFAFESIEPCFSLYELNEQNNPELLDLLSQDKIPFSSPFLDTLQQLPCVFSNMYVLRPIFEYKMNPIKRWLFSAFQSS